eukprot:COSAG01_NODE_40186_length_466_cov_5.743869_1_plen_44_part_10
MCVMSVPDGVSIDVVADLEQLEVRGHVAVAVVSLEQELSGRLLP